MLSLLSFTISVAFQTPNLTGPINHYKHRPRLFIDLPLLSKKAKHFTTQLRLDTKNLRMYYTGRNGPKRDELTYRRKVQPSALSISVNEPRASEGLGPKWGTDHRSPTGCNKRILHPSRRGV